MQEKLSVEISGQKLESIKSFALERSLDSLCGAFHISYLDWGKDSFVSPGDRISISYGLSPLMLGYVETFNRDFDESSHRVSISGRDITCDLIDCSYMGASAEFTGRQSLFAIAESLASPFGIRVMTKLAKEVQVESFKIALGESLFEALERAARNYGLVFKTSPQGELVLENPRASTSLGNLIEGLHLKGGSLSYDESSRFSHYLVKGQDANGANIKAEAFDKTIERYRPFVLASSEETTKELLSQRAAWENGVRASRSFSVEVDLLGWEVFHGRIWQLGDLVTVHSKMLGLEHTPLMISGFTLSLDEAGTGASLKLSGAKSYEPEVEISELDKPIKSKSRPAKEKIDPKKELLRKYGWLD